MLTDMLLTQLVFAIIYNILNYKCLSQANNNKLIKVRRSIMRIDEN